MSECWYIHAEHVIGKKSETNKNAEKECQKRHEHRACSRYSQQDGVWRREYHIEL